MAVEVIFPRVDMDMTTGRINRWLAEEGSTVRKGDPLFEIETDKAAMEIEAPAAGTLHTVRAADGAEIPVGSPVAWIVPQGEAWQPRGAVPEAAAAPADSAVPPPRAETVAQPVPGGSLRATPLARREAARLGIDLQKIAGSGPRGRIVSADLDGAPPPVPALRPAPAGVAPAKLFRTWVGRADGTPVVFVHGFAADHSGWRPVWTRLEPALRMLGLDLPGHGRSAGEGAASFVALVDAVRTVLAEEGIRRAHLVGHSLGGAVALALADSAEIDIRSLTLLAPAGLGPEVDAAALGGIVRAQRAESLAPWLRRLFADPAMVTPAYVEAVLRARAVPGLRDFQAALAAEIFPDATQALDLRGVLERLTVPMKIIWGVRDLIIPVGQARGLPGAVALHTLAHAGHMPHIEAQGLIATLLLQSHRAGE